MKNTSRITADKVDCLDIRIEEIERVGFVSFLGSRWHNRKVKLEKPTETIELTRLKDVEREANFIGVIESYLVDNNLYLSHATHKVRDFCGFIPGQLSGDLYKQK